jgi:glutathione synthase
MGHGLTVMRRTLSEVSKRAVLKDGFLFVDAIEIALVYFRAGYGPEHYPTSNEWDARLLMERSKTVKVPSIQAQLAGTKKVQQLWYSEGGAVLAKFGLSESEIEALMQVFAVQTDPAKDARSVALALTSPDKWVLKPQREGGGHNLYDGALEEALRTFSKSELSQYVLMERMTPMTDKALVVDGSKSMESKRIVPCIIDDAVSELGIFSYFLPSTGENVVSGHLLRTKQANIREGGVNAGFSALDTATLV